MILTKALRRQSVGSFFYCIGNSFGIPYTTKKPSGQYRTAAERNYVAGATRRRRRILRSRILFLFK